MKWLNGNRKLVVVESVLATLVVVALKVHDPAALITVCGSVVAGGGLFFKFNLDEHKTKKQEAADAG